MPFSARQGFISGRITPSGFPNWPTQATATQFTAETSQYAGSTSGATGNVFAGAFGGFKEGALRAPNGNIYFLPATSGEFQEYDPSSNANTTISMSPAIGNDDYHFGSLGGNGNIYLGSHDATGIYEFDPVNGTGRAIDAGLTAGGENTRGVVTDKTGNVFAISNRSSGDLSVKIDCSTEPVTVSTTTFNGMSANSNKYATPALHTNGNIYCMGGTADHVLELDPVNLTHTEHGTLSAPAFSGSIRYKSTVIGADSCIYGVPYDSDTIAKFDPSTNTLSESDYGSGDFKANNYNSATLTSTGEIYMVPHLSSGTAPDTIPGKLGRFKPQLNEFGPTSIGVGKSSGGSGVIGICSDEANLYICADGHNENNIIGIAPTGGQNANAFTLSAYTNNSG